MSGNSNIILTFERWFYETVAREYVSDARTGSANRKDI